MKKKIILKSSVLGLVAGTSIMFSSVFADQVGVQVIGVNVTFMVHLTILEQQICLTEKLLMLALLLN